jgi:hypothetical protein
VAVIREFMGEGPLGYLVDSEFGSLERADQALDFTKLRVARSKDNHWIQVTEDRWIRTFTISCTQGFRG